MAKIVPLPDGSKLVKEEVSGPSSYTAGGFPVRMRELSVVTEVVRAKCDTRGAHTSRLGQPRLA